MEVCCETDSKETNKIEQGQDKADAVWAQLSTAYQHIETLPGDTVVCLKVMPADIGRLPRPNWMLDVQFCEVPLYCICKSDTRTL